MCLMTMAHVMSHPKGLQMLLWMMLYLKLELGIPRSQLGLRWVKGRHLAVVLHASASATKVLNAGPARMMTNMATQDASKT